MRSKSMSLPIPGVVSVHLQPVARVPNEASVPEQASSEWQQTSRSKAKPANHDRVGAAVAQYLNLVWRLLRRAGLRHCDADDATQDVFWVFAQRMDAVPVLAERAFLAATALRVASERRRSKWYRNATEPFDDELLARPTASPEQAIEHRRRIDMLDQALTFLDPKERDVFILSELEELSKAEVALALRIPEGTVASRLQRARVAFNASVARLQREKGLLL